MKVTTKRHVTKHGRKGKPMVLGVDHPAVVGATPLFPNRLKTPNHDDKIFKSGINNRKIGSHVTKGMWSGMPIFTLTLAERTTCPKICEHWRSCYGNHMQWPTRWKAGAELEKTIPWQIAELAAKHPDGFVVRLHVLGDFYSVAYVDMWRALMRKHDALHVYGYTRRAKINVMGHRLQCMNEDFSLRWRVRWSERGGVLGTSTTADVTARGRTEQGIVCPAQTEGDEVSCGSCGLCWNSEEPIVFINH